MLEYYVKQSRNNDVLFSVEFHIIGKRRNNFVKITISKNTKKDHFKLNTLNSKF